MDRKTMHTNHMKEEAQNLKAGDMVLLTGTIYTARDAAHKRLTQMIEAGEPLPFTLNGASIYYAGPTPAPKGLPIGSCGPTTASRMDSYTPKLLDLGLACMIGKGERSQSVIDAIVRNQAIYLCAIGGAGALAAQCVQTSEVIAFDDLGCESIKKLTIQDFPLLVAIDSHGHSLFK